MAEPSHHERLAEYQRLRDAGIAAGEQGKFSEALPILEAALDVAQGTGDAALRDLAYCNWASAKIGLAEGSEILPELRELLVRNQDPATCRLAAYNISLIYELSGDGRKGLFYARIARDRTGQMESPAPSWIASSHNQIANFLVADSRFDEALDEYRLAQDADPAAEAFRQSQIGQNIGYCHLMLGRVEQAFGLLFSSLRAYRRLGAVHALALNHLDLAYAYLEAGRPRPAIRHAERALAAAQGQGDEHNAKNALYLLGEAWHLGGDDDHAREAFQRLADCYDDLPFIADFLLTVDVRQMINLRA